jgi:ribonuclease P/MRP protein subunit RPP1
MFDQSCGDLNVDIVSVPLEEKINFNLKKNLIRAAINKGIFFEISYCEFIKDMNKRTVFISNVLSLLDVTKGKNLILSSGCDNFIYHRSPYDIIMMFQTIFDLKKEFVQDLISKNCENAYLKSSIKI